MSQIIPAQEGQIFAEERSGKEEPCSPIGLQPIV